MEASNTVATLVQSLQSADNTARQGAEQEINTMRAANARALYEGLWKSVISADSVEGVKALSCLLLKKYFLDMREEEKEMEQLVEDDYKNLIQGLQQNMDLSESMNLLRRKAEVLVKCYKFTKNFDEIVAQIEQMMSAPQSEEVTVITGKVIAMYMFDMLAEYHLDVDAMTAKHETFMTMFGNCLSDTNPSVRAATLKTMTNFLIAIGDEDVVMQYANTMENLLDIVIEVIKLDESKGQESLESLIELTSSYGLIWKDSIKKLIFVCSEVMKNKEFEDNTRQSAMEVITTVAETSRKLVKENQDEMKEQFYPAIGFLMTSIELADDLDEWYKVQYEDILVGNDLASKAAESLERLSECVGEKMTVACCTQMVTELVQHQDW